MESLAEGGQHHYRLETSGADELELRQHRQRVGLRLAGSLIAKVHGICQVPTGTRGRVPGVVGTAPQATTLACDGTTQEMRLEP